MAQTISTEAAVSLQETQKQQRQQAKRASKMRLKIEKAKGEVLRTDQKLAKDRLDHQLAVARLRTLEEEFHKMGEGEPAGAKPRS
ncbi:MAG: hypothetical protein H0W02_20490 [Ktedonobacteraceae bacterium]|nr:hypothetical protein [Ktedonobacteraceae bacterium]